MSYGSTTTTGPTITVNEALMPKIAIDDLVYQKIMYWVNKSDDEVSGLGMVRRVGETFHVLDVFLLPQKNGSAHTDIEPEDVGKLMYEQHKKLQEGEELEGELRFWWHSHVNMAVYWSNTDTDTMKKLAVGGHFVCTVFNKRRELRSAIVFNEPFAAMIDNIPTSIARSLDGNLVKGWDEEYTKMVTEHRPKYPTYHGNYHPQRGTSPEQRAVESQVRRLWPEGEKGGYSGVGSTQGSSESPTEVREPGRPRSLLADGGFQTPGDLIALRDQLELKISRIEEQEANIIAKKRPIPGGMLAAKAKHQEKLDEVEEALDIMQHYNMITEEQRYGVEVSNAGKTEDPPALPPAIAQASTETKKEAQTEADYYGGYGWE